MLKSSHKPQQPEQRRDSPWKKTAWRTLRLLCRVKSSSIVEQALPCRRQGATEQMNYLRLAVLLMCSSSHAGGMVGVSRLVLSLLLWMPYSEALGGGLQLKQRHKDGSGTHTHSQGTH